MTPSTVEEALKPCPFCASVNVDPEGWASTDNEGGNPRSGPACDDCGASADSVERWNTRPHQIEAQGSEPGGARWRPRAELLAMLDGLLATYMKGERLPDVVDMSALSEAAECIRALTRPDPSLGSVDDEALIALARRLNSEGRGLVDQCAAVAFGRAVLAMASPPSLGMEGLQALRELSDAATPGPWDTMTGRGLVRALRGDIAVPLFEAITPWEDGPAPTVRIGNEVVSRANSNGARESQAFRREWHNAALVSAAVNYVRQALASISTPSGEGA